MLLLTSVAVVVPKTFKCPRWFLLRRREPLFVFRYFRMGQSSRRRRARTMRAPEHPPRGRIDLATGTAKWFIAEKDFGFIEQDGGGADVFAHYSNIAAQGYRELNEGQKVSFDVTQGRKGPP